MLKISAIILLMGGILVLVPPAYSGDSATMSDVQHRKTMGGMHHPEPADDTSKKNAEKESPIMSDAQHRKTMSGMHHPKPSDNMSKQDTEKESPTMSDVQHRKTMGGMHHPDKD